MKRRPQPIRLAFAFLVILVFPGNLRLQAESLEQSLAGAWRVRLDPEDVGIVANWPAAPLLTSSRIVLPGTTDRAGLGSPLDTNTMLHGTPFPVTTRFPGVNEPQKADEHGYLVRRHLFVGRAWYERDIEIPRRWQGMEISLRIERALWQTRVWVDGLEKGVDDSLVTEHRHNLGVLAPGRHRLTVCVDNRMLYNISTITHAYGPETQTRWNGLLGQISLEAKPPVSIESLAIFPAADRRSVRAELRIRNAQGTTHSLLRLRLLEARGRKVQGRAEQSLELPAGESRHSTIVTFKESAKPWDEFDPVLYRLEAELMTGEKPIHRADAQFGFRHAVRAGRHLQINGRTVFLRGTLDCAVYPRAGHPPMTVPEWTRVMKVIKNYGFNHVRFHTWCPPEAAFQAADQLGLYLQVEAPAWIDDWGLQTVTRPLGIGKDPEVTDFLRRELRRMSEAYGNHPSFLFCAIGNEFGLQGTDWDQVNAMVAEIKAKDPRRLYAGCGARKRLEADDFWFTHNTGVSTRGVGPGHTDWDFAKAAEASPVPLLAHETGQRPVFPDYAALLPKFIGPLAPLNLERYRRGLVQSGLAEQANDFVRASARFQLTQYKAEHEAMLRTPGYSGYQLLMLNDFTGQSEALVGILDPFWEPKGVVSAREVRQWNSPTVLLARFPSYVLVGGDELQARLQVAHFGPTNLGKQTVRWWIREGAKTIARGMHRLEFVPTGGLSEAGTIRWSVPRTAHPAALKLQVRMRETENEWPLWRMPDDAPAPEPPGIWVTQRLDTTALAALEQGGRVLLLAHGMTNAFTARTGFESVYWSAGWWGTRFSSLGLLCDPDHPLFRGFPNPGVSDWVWRDLCAGATTFDLSDGPPSLRPLVQPVPDFHFNTRLGQVVEARVGPGRLLVCGFDLSNQLDRRPAARQFRRSLFEYVASPRFQPSTHVAVDWAHARWGD